MAERFAAHQWAAANRLRSAGLADQIMEEQFSLIRNHAIN